MKRSKLQKGTTAIELVVASSILLTLSFGIATFLPAGFKANEINRKKMVSANLFHQVMEEVNTLEFANLNDNGTESSLGSSLTKVILDTTQKSVSLDTSTTEPTVTGDTVTIGSGGKAITYPRFYRINNVDYRIDIKVLKGRYDDLMAAQPAATHFWSRVESYLQPQAMAASNNTGTAQIVVSPNQSGYKNTTSFNFSVNCTHCPPQNHRVYNWNFGIGEGPGSSDPSPSHIFSQAGLNQKVHLTISDRRDLNVAISSETQLNVKDSSVTIQMNPSNPIAGQSVSFSASCGQSAEVDCGSSPVYRWAFGDGHIASGQSVTHTYTESSDYTASVSVAGGADPTATLPLNVLAENGQQAGLQVLPQNTGFAGDPGNQITTVFSFQTSSVGYQGVGASSVLYRLNFGDGSPAIEQTDANPEDSDFPVFSHVYTQGGSYSVSLEAVPQGVDSNTAQKTETSTTVQAQSYLELNSDQVNILVGSSVSFTTAVMGTGTSPEYKWDFGDGHQQSDFAGHATHAFLSPGTYNVALQVMGGTQPSSTKQITVRPLQGSQNQALMKKVYVYVSPWTPTPTAGQRPLSTGVFLKGDNK